MNYMIINGHGIWSFSFKWDQLKLSYSLPFFWESWFSLLQHALIMPPSKERYFDESDELILEDELQRIALRGKLDVQQYVTGTKLTNILLPLRTGVRLNLFGFFMCLLIFLWRVLVIMYVACDNCFRCYSGFVGKRTWRRQRQVPCWRCLFSTIARAGTKTCHRWGQVILFF